MIGREWRIRMSGIAVVITGIGLISAGSILFIISMLYQSLVGKKIIKELLDKYE